VTDDDLDRLLALAAQRFTSPGPVTDAGKGLRRLASDVARFRSGTYQPAPWWDAVARARPKLESLCGWVLNQPGAVGALRRWAETSSELDRPLGARLDFEQLAYLRPDGEFPLRGAAGDGSGQREPLAIVGARVFGCLLHRTGHPVSAAFWWRFAAGDQDRISAYCLYLLHLGRGDLHQAQAWFEAAIPRSGEPHEDRGGVAPLENFPHLLNVCVGNTEVQAERERPTDSIRRAVDRLVEASAREGDDEGIAARPDHELAEILADMACP